MAVLGIYGASGLGREILELAKEVNNAGGKWDRFVFIDDGETPSVVDGCEVFKYDEAKKSLGDSLQIAMGIGEPMTRKKLFSKIWNDGLYTPTIIHPDVHIPDTANIGNGVTIQSDCFVSVGVTINDYALLQTKCAVGHDSVIGEGCIISTFCSIAGAVTIGQYSYIGMSAAVRELVSIGEYSVIGMGSMVLKDIPDEMIAMGNPARPMKRNENHKVFGH